MANEQNGCARNALYVVLRLLFDRESRQDCTYSTPLRSIKVGINAGGGGAAGGKGDGKDKSGCC